MEIIYMQGCYSRAYLSLRRRISSPDLWDSWVHVFAGQLQNTLPSRSVHEMPPPSRQSDTPERSDSMIGRVDISAVTGELPESMA
jgi:hypothetical protein